MIIRCTKCSTEFDLDPSQVGPEGVTLRCSVCGHMFHAEPEPESDASAAPWRLATVEKHLFELPTLRDIVEHIEDGRLRPDDQLSHTGRHWLKLREIPEFATLFIGHEGLPRVFRAVESQADDLGPPPSFGTGVDEPPPVVREQKIHFPLGGPLEPMPEPALPTLEDDSSPLPAPPQFDTPPPRHGRTKRSTEGIASMLDAVTKAVSESPPPLPEVDEPVARGTSVRGRSQPILVSDLARAAAQRVADTVQRVDDQRAAERSARERLELSERRPADAGRGEGSSRTPVRGDKSATAAAVAAAVATLPSPTPTIPPQTIPPSTIPPTTIPPSATPTVPPTTIPPSEVAVTSETSAAVVEPKPPDVVIVKVGDTTGGRSGSGGVFALAGVLVAIGIVFGVPSIRERVLNLGGRPPVVAKNDTKAQAELPPEFATARNALRTLGDRETKRAISGLERIIDDANRDPAIVAAAKLQQAELMLYRVLSNQIALMLDPENSQYQRVVDADLPDAKTIVEGLADVEGLPRVQALLLLAQGRPEGEVVAGLPEQARDIRALALGGPLWRDREAAVPSGLITSLQGVPNPTALHQSLLALALWRSGDDEGARKVLDGVLGRVGDMPTARALRSALEAAAAEKGETLPPQPEPPPEPPAEPVPGDTSDKPPSEPAGTTPRPQPRPTVASGDPDSIETLVSTGCQKVKSGDASGGIKLLLQAVDKRGDSKNFELCMCLANGFLAQNNHDTALAWFKRAVGQSPANRDAIAGVARAAELAGKQSVAVEFYRKLLDIEPNNQQARNYLAKHDDAGKSATPPPDDVGELMPVGGKKKTP